MESLETLNINQDDDVDRISELPQGILQHIQSLLSMKEIAQHALLSKRWKQVSFPSILEFDESFFPRILWTNEEEEEENEEEADEKQKALVEVVRYFDHVDRILAPFGKHKLSKNRFKLEMLLIELDWSPRIDQWIQQAVAGSVQELFIHIYPYRYIIEDKYEFDKDKFYNLPHHILVVKTIMTLSIEGCRIEFLPANFKTNLSSLKKLSLHWVHLNDDALHKIIAGCHLVEDLIIHECEGFKTLHIPSSLVNLRRLSVAECSSNFENHTPIEFFCVEAFNIVDIELENLESPQKFDLHACKNLKSLIVNYVAASEGLEHSNFPSLEKLTLWNLGLVGTLKIESHRLNYLAIRHCERLTGIELETPNLLAFDYGGDNVGFSWNGTIPSRCSIFLRLYPYPYPNENEITNWYSERIKFLAKFNIEGCREMAISCYEDQGLIFPNELRLAHPLPDLKKLTVKMYSGRVDEFSEELIDSIRWISPHSEKKHELISKFPKPFSN